MGEVLEVEAAPVEAGALAPSFEAEFRPAELHANFDALKRWALDVAGGYDGESYDPNDECDVAQAKRDRAYFNGLVRDVDQRRKAVKAEFSRPLAEFEAQCREVTDVLKGASDAAARVVELGERIRVDRKREALEAEYRDFAGELAEAVPFAAVMDERWLNKGFATPKALDAMRERAAKVAADWEQLRAREGEPRHDVAERAFLRTLDLGDALAAQASAVEADGRAAALKAAGIGHKAYYRVPIHRQPAMVELARLGQIHRLFTDAPPPEPFPALLAEAGVRCEVAGPAAA